VLVESVLKDTVPNAVVIDIGTGTGDLIFDYMKTRKTTDETPVVGIDLSFSMLLRAQSKLKGESHWIQASAEKLPLGSNSCDALVSAFTIRNLKKILPQTLKEMWRVLKPGGKLFLLEMTVPPYWILKTLHHLYLKTILPIVGRTVFQKEWSGSYLSETILHFWSPDQFCKILTESRFQNVKYQTITGGIAVLHNASKP